MIAISHDLYIIEDHNFRKYERNQRRDRRSIFEDLEKGRIVVLINISDEDV